MLAITTDSVAHIVARRKHVIEHQPEIILGPQPMILNKAPTGKALSAEFLQDFAEPLPRRGQGHLLADVPERAHQLFRRVGATGRGIEIRDRAAAPLTGQASRMKRSISWSAVLGRPRARCWRNSSIRLLRLRPNISIRLILRHHSKTRLLDGGRPQQWPIWAPATFRTGVAAAPWLLYPITRLVGVAAYLYLLPL
jgi:hypothetical protein